MSFIPVVKTKDVELTSGKDVDIFTLDDKIAYYDSKHKNTDRRLYELENSVGKGNVYSSMKDVLKDDGSISMDMDDINKTITLTVRTAQKLNTARGFTIGNSSKAFDGSADVSWTLAEIGAAATDHTHKYAGSSVAGGAANSAIKLNTARSIMIGSSSRKFDGTENVTWTLDDIGAAASSHSHTVSDISNFPSSLPASDVSSWAKQSTKPSYTWSEINGKPDTFTPSSHTHKYAGSTTEGGVANSALKLSMSRTLAIGNSSKAFDGSADVSWSLAEIGAAASVHTHNYAGSTSDGGSATRALECTGNSATATKLETSRTLTIGNTGKTFDGSADVSWTLAEIGAASSSHTHSYLPLSGGTLTGAVIHNAKNNQYTSTGGTWISGKTQSNSPIVFTSQVVTDGSRYDPYLWGRNVSGDVWNFGGGAANTIGFYGFNSSRTENGTDWGFTINITNGNVNSTNNITAPAFIGSLSGNASTATTLQTSRTLTIGNTGKTFNGSNNVSWTLAEIGAASSNHTHNYLPLSGGTMTGAISGLGYSQGSIGSGGNDCAGLDKYNNMNIASWWGISFSTQCQGFTGSTKPAVSIDCRNGYLYTASTIYEGGTALSSKYALKDHTHSYASSGHTHYCLYPPGGSTNYSVGMTSSGDFVPLAGTVYCGTLSTPFPAIYGTTIYEGGTSLSSKYAASSHSHNSLSFSGSTFTINLSGTNVLPSSTALSIGSSSKYFSMVYAIGTRSNKMTCLDSDYNMIQYKPSATDIVYSTMGTTTTGNQVDISSNLTDLRLSGRYINLIQYGRIITNGAVETYSDEKVKKFSDDLDRDTSSLLELFDIIQLKSYKYRYSNENGQICIGFSAQDVEDAFEMIGISPDKYNIVNVEYNYMVSRGGDEDYKFYPKFYSITYDNLYNLAILKMQQMEKDYNSRLTALEERLSTIENRL